MSAPRNIFVVSKETIPDDKEESNFEEKKTMKGTEDSCRKGSKQDESCCTFLAAACKCKYRSSFLVFGVAILVAVLLINVVFFFAIYHSLDKLIQDSKLQCNSTPASHQDIYINVSFWSTQLEILQNGHYMFQKELQFIKNTSSYQFSKLVETTRNLEEQTKANISYLNTQGIMTTNNLMNLSDHVDHLLQSGDHHGTQLGLINSSLSGLLNQLIHVQDHLSALNSSQLSQDQQITTHHSSISKLEAVQNTSSHHLSNLTESLDNLEQQTRMNILYLNTTVAEITMHMQNLSEHVNLLLLSRVEHQNHLSALNSSQHSQDQQITTLHSSISKLEAVQNTSLHHLSNLTESLDNLEQQTRMNILYLNTTVAEITMHMQNLSEHVNLLLLSRVEHQNHLSQIDSRLSSISGKLIQVDSHLSRLNVSLQSHNREITTLQSSVSTLRTELISVNSRITEQRNTLDQKISQLDTNVKSVQSANSYATNDRRDIESRVNELESLHTSTIINCPTLSVLFFCFLFACSTHYFCWTCPW